MKCKYAVTFEFMTQPPITERGEAEGSALRTIVARSIDSATSKRPGLTWSSVSILIDREDT